MASLVTHTFFCHFFRRPVPVEFAIASQPPVTEPKLVVASEPRIRFGHVGLSSHVKSQVVTSLHSNFTTVVMVKVEIVEEKETANSPYGSLSASRTNSTDSLSSIASDVSVEESFLERVAALADVIPPATRHSISSRISKTASFLRKGRKIAGSIIWVVTTSALLVALPLALSLEDEAKIVAQEKEMLEQQQGAQQVCCLFGGTCHWVLHAFSSFLLIAFALRCSELCIHPTNNNQKLSCLPVSRLSPSFRYVVISLCVYAIRYLTLWLMVRSH